MKKIFSIFIIALIALTSNIFNADAGNINFRFNIKDAAGNPVSGVSVNVNAEFFNASGQKLTPEKVVATVGPSGDDGLATGTASFNNAGNYAYNWGVGDGWIIFGPTFPAYQSVWRLSAIGPAGYSFITRDFKTSSNATMSGAAGNDERFSLTGGWLDSGATINYDVIVNTPAPVLSFDTSEIQNKSDFESRTIEKGSTIDPATIPTPACINANKEFQYWSTDGITPFDFTQTITSNIKLIPVFKIEISFDTSTISNASSFPTYYVAKGSTISAPSTTPVNATHSDWEFVSWSVDGSAAFDFSKPVNADVTLKPVWNNPNLQGLIHFKVFMWDHAAYDAHPNVQDYSNFSGTVTGKNGNTVKSNFNIGKYQSNAGWTEIPVSSLRFTLRQYPHQGGAPVNPQNVGEIITNENGEATLTLNSYALKSLNAGWVIDTDPDPNCLGSLVRDPKYGREYCVFNWDWMTMANPQGAGVMGVRYIKEGVRHDDLGIKISNFNDNDAMLITSDNINNGFEFTFYCYVLPAPCAQFEVNGGTMPDSTDPALYPIQKFVPLNSAGVAVAPYIVKDPGNPTAPAGYEFEGWHNVRKLLDGTENIDPNPYVFTNTPIDKSIVLRAIYGKDEPKYTVRWAPDTWTGTPDTDLYEMTTTYKDGNLPTYNHDLPTKVGGKFQGWDVYVKDDGGSKSFGELGNYSFVKTLKQPKSASDTGDDFMTKREATMSTFWESKVAIAGADQIYVAKFNIFQTITVVKTGLKSGDSAIFTLTDGTDTRKIVLTGKGDEPVSKTVVVGTGDWTVTEETSWSWAYEAASVSQDVTVNEGEQKTVTFANSSKNTTPSHDESSVNNVFSK